MTPRLRERSSRPGAEAPEAGATLLDARLATQAALIREQQEAIARLEALLHASYQETQRAQEVAIRLLRRMARAEKGGEHGHN